MHGNDMPSPLIRPMLPRDPSEGHRAATVLELFFDLVSVVAIAAAATGLHHAVAEGHAIQGAITYVMAFFAVWWAWMNYTWFASAYDNDDVGYRLLTLGMMIGALIMAAGIGALFKGLDLRLVVIGYVIMRLAMVWLWLRAARGDPARAAAARTYALGITLAQAYWIGIYLLGLPEAATIALFFLGVAIELAVPAMAERRSPTPWHRHHIIERYGLLNIIVLGETLLAASIALRDGMGGETDAALVGYALCGAVIVFAMWWLYFAREEHLETSDLSRALLWGYGHYAIFAAGAAVGAGIAVEIEVATHHAHTTARAAHLSVAIPLAVYILGLWLIRDRYHAHLKSVWILPLGAAILVAVAAISTGLATIAILTVAIVVIRNLVAARHKPLGETQTPLTTKGS